MRLSFAVGVALTTVVTVFACSSTTVESSSGNPSLDGSIVDDDGSVVDQDGNVVPVDGAKGSLVDVSTAQVTVNGKSRSYLIAVPKSYAAARSYPLILVIHGDGGDGPSMRQYHPLDAETGDAAIVVYPTGTDNGWDHDTPFAQNDDQQYIEAIVGAVKSSHNVDGARVFGVGWSSGGFLVNQLACRRATLFKAIVSHAGGAPYETPGQYDAAGYPKCGSGAGVPALVTHGGSDTTVTPDSGDYSAKTWAHLVGCDPDTRADTTPSPCKKHTGCPAGKAVTYCQIPGNGHGIWTQAIAVEWAFLKAL